jgi:predicted dienelactone hydrolase
MKVAPSLALLLLGASPLAATGYDPLATPPRVAVRQEALSVRDAKRDGREIPLRVYRDAGTALASPVVLFSHGLGGSRDGSAYLGEHWAARGYVAVFLQHPGSDEAVWKDAPLRRRREAMEDAASARSFLDRVRDVGAVLDALATWNGTRGHSLEGRLDLARVGMAGHSFGAMTTQAVSGQRFRGRDFADPRIRAALVLSPSTPRRGDPAEAFAGVTRPWLLMTGTRDGAPIGNQTPETRLQVFPHLPAGDKYELVLDGAEHSAFGDRALRGEEGPRNPNHHRAVLALSTAFWDAYLKQDAVARAWLQGSAPRGVLEARDRWQAK